MSTKDNNPYETPSSVVDETTVDVINVKLIPNKRICAYLLDMTILLIFEVAVSFLSGMIAGIFTFGYILFRDALIGGASVGKRIVGLRVIDINGNPCTPLKSLLRNIILIPLSVIPIALLIEYFAMNFSKKEQRLGDRIAKTFVKDLFPDRSDKMFLLYSIILIIAMMGAVSVLFYDAS